MATTLTTRRLAALTLLAASAAFACNLLGCTASSARSESTLDVTVRDSSGAPVEGAFVSVSTPERPTRAIARAETDANGHARVTALPQRRLLVQAFPDSWAHSGSSLARSRRQPVVLTSCATPTHIEMPGSLSERAAGSR